MARSSRYVQALGSRRFLRHALASLLFAVIAAVLLLLLAVGVLFLPVNPPEEQLLTYQNNAMDESLVGEREPPLSEVLSWMPRVFVYHNFLSMEECDYLINLGKNRMVRSAVSDTSTGQARRSRYRTSSSFSLKRGQDEIIRAIEKRIADFTFIPVGHGEPLQVVHYKHGERYASHRDYFSNEYSIKSGKQRAATFLMYLSNVDKGGETVFPRANESDPIFWNGKRAFCGERGLSIRPRKGDAILFWNLKPDGTPDPLSLHESCPVIKGHKWACTKWLHVNHYREK